MPVSAGVLHLVLEVKIIGTELIFFVAVVD
jgi:hypothetical protein